MENENKEKTLDFDDEIIRTFVGENTDYYIEKWQTSKDPAKNPSWNWSSFLVGWLWLGYRKMHSTFLWFFGVLVAIDIIDIFFGLHFICLVARIALMVIMGVFGNALYYNHMKKTVTNIQNNYKNVEEQKLEIEKDGGTSWFSLAILWIVMILYSILWEALMAYK
ncbi:DUF2628 domain-containing protein [Selenomonadales bacterium OttesenSCG-928-I06]|nr:DUF2628 domain-containing protein [Selenomonadales bacterium OttesenSCG-928-I06]